MSNIISENDTAMNTFETINTCKTELAEIETEDDLNDSNLNINSDICLKQSKCDVEDTIIHKSKIKKDLEYNNTISTKNIKEKHAEIEIIFDSNFNDDNDDIHKTGDYIYCKKCGDDYDGFCSKCPNLSHFLNSNILITSSDWKIKSAPTNIVEIRNTSNEYRAFAMKTLPKDVIFGPFQGIPSMKDTNDYKWVLQDGKLLNIENGNWMQYINCGTNISSRNLEIIQFQGNLYFQTTKEIHKDEELLIFYSEMSDNSYYAPILQEKFRRMFVCTRCCLGFRSRECLVEHKSKCPHGIHRIDVSDIIECNCCKIWLEKQENLEYHEPYCWENDPRICKYPMAIVRSQAFVANKQHSKYQCHNCGKTFKLKNIMKKHIISNHIAKNKTDYKCSYCSYRTKLKRNLTLHLNTHKDITVERVLYQCDVCKFKFKQKGNLKVHMKLKHTKAGDVKAHKCPKCPYKTNYKHAIKVHIETHKRVRIRTLRQCDICFKIFKLAGTLRRHIEMQHDAENGPLRCDICKEKFPGTETLKTHIELMHLNGIKKKYKCLQCSFETDARLILQKHIITHKGIKAFQCKICLAKFTQSAALSAHMEYKHAETSEKKYKCSLCSYETNYEPYLRRHNLTHNTAVKQFECSICNMTFARNSTLKSHFKNKHTKSAIDNEYKCSECSYQANSRYKIRSHLQRHTGIKQYQCDICLMKFSFKSGLTAHMKGKHIDNVQYNCSQCSYHATYKSCLTQHLKTHSDLRPFECGICTKTFKKKDLLKLHVNNVHTEYHEKEFKCLHCSYRTNRKDALVAHLRRHSDVKSVECSICEGKFKNQLSLKRHAKEQHWEGERKEYKCSQCSYKTYRTTSLRAHMIRHSDDRPFQCRFCEVKVKSGQTLKRHVAKVHKNEHVADENR